MTISKSISKWPYCKSWSRFLARLTGVCDRILIVFGVSCCFYRVVIKSCLFFEDILDCWKCLLSHNYYVLTIIEHKDTLKSIQKLDYLKISLMPLGFRTSEPKTMLKLFIVRDTYIETLTIKIPIPRNRA